MSGFIGMPTNDDIERLTVRLNALQREVAFCLGQIYAATPALTALRGPLDNMNRILADFHAADAHAIANMRRENGL